jgi:hypothetical protein
MTRLIAFLIVIVLLLNCSKTGETTHTNCDGLITDTLGTNDNGRVWMPNAISPNNDGLNDLSRPITENISSIVFTIYDGNNSIVFTSTELNMHGWETTIGNDSYEIYYYKIQAVTSSGNHIGVCGELYLLKCFPSNISKSSLYFEDQLTPFGFTFPTSEILPDCP